MITGDATHATSSSNTLIITPLLAGILANKSSVIASGHLRHGPTLLHVAKRLGAVYSIGAVMPLKLATVSVWG